MAHVVFSPEQAQPQGTKFESRLAVLTAYYREWCKETASAVCLQHSHTAT
jgi:hypothetical protein